MSKLNEKLTASVKATGSRATPAKPPVKPVAKAKPAAAAAKPAADKAVVKTTGMPDPDASGSALFPSRVWPD